MPNPKGPGIFKAGVGLQNDPVYKEAISQIIKYSIASYISDEQTKNSILELLDSRKATVELIAELETEAENDEVKKAALLEAQYKLKIINLTTPTNNSILSHIEDHRKPSLLEYVLHKMKRFTQTYSKKKFAERLLERDKLDHLMENLLKNPNYDEELYENLKIRAQEMEDEDLRLQVERNKDFSGTQEDRESKIFLTLENAKKGYHEIHKLQKGPIITLTDPA